MFASLQGAADIHSCFVFLTHVVVDGMQLMHDTSCRWRLKVNLCRSNSCIRRIKPDKAMTKKHRALLPRGLRC